MQWRDGLTPKQVFTSDSRGSMLRLISHFFLICHLRLYWRWLNTLIGAVFPLLQLSSALWIFPNLPQIKDFHRSFPHQRITRTLWTLLCCTHLRLTPSLRHVTSSSSHESIHLRSLWGKEEKLFFLCYRSNAVLSFQTFRHEHFELLSENGTWTFRFVSVLLSAIEVNCLVPLLVYKHSSKISKYVSEVGWRAARQPSTRSYGN